MKITSVNNDIVKEVSKLHQRKYRDESGLFLLEGEKCVREAIEYGVELKYLFVLENNGYKNLPVLETTEAVLSKISSTVSPPPIVGVGKQINRIWSNDFRKVVLLEDIKDAGNLGTIIRTSCAFGVDAIILYGDTVDLYNPKCVRAAVGNLWKIPVFNVKDAKELEEKCNNFIPISTIPKNDKSEWLKEIKFPEKCLIMFGTESSGLSEKLKNYAITKGKSVTIEMSENVESLNLSMSAGIILYEMYKNKK